MLYIVLSLFQVANKKKINTCVHEEATKSRKTTARVSLEQLTFCGLLKVLDEIDLNAAFL